MIQINSFKYIFIGLHVLSSLNAMELNESNTEIIHSIKTVRQRRPVKVNKEQQFYQMHNRDSEKCWQCLYFVANMAFLGTLLSLHYFAQNDNA